VNVVTCDEAAVYEVIVRPARRTYRTLVSRDRMSKSNRDKLISRYREGPAVLADAVSGLTERQLNRKPSDGGFSAREVVHHTADSEMTSAIRLRRLVAEDNPQITGYDPDLFRHVSITAAARCSHLSTPLGQHANQPRQSSRPLARRSGRRPAPTASWASSRSIRGSRYMPPTATTTLTRCVGR
jgi:hypothetical protein